MHSVLLCSNKNNNISEIDCKNKRKTVCYNFNIDFWDTELKEIKIVEIVKEVKEIEVEGQEEPNKITN